MRTTHYVYREVNAGRMTVAQGMAELDQAQAREAALERLFGVLRWTLVTVACLLLLVLLFFASPAAAHAPPLERLPHAMLAQAADAAPAPAPAQGVGDMLLGFLSPGTVGTVLGVVASLIGGLAFLNVRRKRIVAVVFQRAYQGVNDIAASDEVTDGWDKTAAYLREIDKRLVAAGWRPLSPEEAELAKLEAKSMHGAEQQAIKIASAAAVAAAKAAPPSPH